MAAIAKRDRDGLRLLLADDVDFKGLTPKRVWDGRDARTRSTRSSSTTGSRRTSASPPSPCSRPGTSPASTASATAARSTPRNGPRVVEQQAYYKVKDDRIVHMRIVCSGFRVP